MGKNSKKSCQKRHGSYKPKEKIAYQINSLSTYKTFLQWLNECGNDLCECGNHLSFANITDGHDISLEKVGYARFDQPDQVEEFLVKEGYYDGHTLCGNFEVPSIHYVDWFNNLIKH